MIGMGSIFGAHATEISGRSFRVSFFHTTGEYLRLQKKISVILELLIAASVAVHKYIKTLALPRLTEDPYRFTSYQT